MSVCPILVVGSVIGLRQCLSDLSIVKVSFSIVINNLLHVSGCFLNHFKTLCHW